VRLLLVLSLTVLPACGVEAPAALEEVPDGYSLESRVDALDAQLLALETRSDRTAASQSAQLAQLTARVVQLEQGLSMTCALNAQSAVERARREAVGAWSPPVPDRAARFMTDTVVRLAVRDTLEYGGDFDAASYNARDQAFQAVAALGGHEQYHDAYDVWRVRVLDVARRHLADPGRLEATWRKNKPAVLEEIQRAERGNQVRRALLDQVIPLFSEPVSAEVRAVNAEVSAAWEIADATEYGTVCWRANHDNFAEIEGRLEELPGVSDVRTLQWRLRREAEGGDALVAAWRGIFEDLAEALD